MESISVSVGRKRVGFSDVVKQVGIVWNGASLVPSQALENAHSFGRCSQTAQAWDPLQGHPGTWQDLPPVLEN